ncbi:MAG: hypothetical protein R3F34_08135 [Planctomycetota bacterium]
MTVPPKPSRSVPNGMELEIVSQDGEPVGVRMTAGNGWIAAVADCRCDLAELSELREHLAYAASMHGLSRPYAVGATETEPSGDSFALRLDSRDHAGQWMLLVDVHLRADDRTAAEQRASFTMLVEPNQIDAFVDALTAMLVSGGDRVKLEANRYHA